MDKLVQLISLNHVHNTSDLGVSINSIQSIDPRAPRKRNQSAFPKVRSSHSLRIYWICSGLTCRAFLLCQQKPRTDHGFRVHCAHSFALSRQPNAGPLQEAGTPNLWGLNEGRVMPKAPPPAPTPSSRPLFSPWKVSLLRCFLSCLVLWFPFEMRARCAAKRHEKHRQALAQARLPPPRFS